MSNNKKTTVVHQSDYPLWLKYALLSGILIITFWCYHYTLSNQFTNWDDYLYVYQNSFIKEFSSQNLKVLLFGVPTQSNYHPLTMLSLALNWHYSGLSPQAYYATQIILHLLNTVLVFFLSLALLQAMVKKGYGEIKGIPYLAGLCALWHGIHPMHVESVSWLAERKDVLYLFFYLSGLIFYVKYVMEQKRTLLVLVFLFYVLSLLSKPMAVVFPLSLFSIDILLKRNIARKALFEKIPFLITSFIFGCITYKLQKEGGAISSFHALSIVQRISISGYNYLMYLVKLFIPTNLCPYYPYPALTGSNNLPFYFYLTPFAAIAITGGLLYLAYKKGENYFRVALFGFGFYFVNVLFVLQFVSAGNTIMADRYSYAAYIGFTFMLVYFIYALLEKIPAYKIPVIIVITAFSCMLAYLCRARMEIWHNSETVWSDVINQYPDRVPIAYANLGNYYYANADFDKAYTNYQESIKLAADPIVYCNIGTLMSAKKQYALALGYYTSALKLDSNYGICYFNRGLAYTKTAEYTLAIKDFRKALTFNPSSENILGYIAYAYLTNKQLDSAITYYTRVIQINPDNAGYYHSRGEAEYNIDSIKPAMNDFMQNLRIAPHDSECMFYLSVVYNHINDFNTAFKYAEMAQNAKYPVPENYFNSLKSKLKKRE